MGSCAAGPRVWVRRGRRAKFPVWFGSISCQLTGEETVMGEDAELNDRGFLSGVVRLEGWWTVVVELTDYVLVWLV